MSREDQRPPRVSVLLVVRDGEATIAEAVESILAQSHRDLELVLVDDGSRDATAERAERAARGDPRLRLFREPARGLATQLNGAAERARGPLLARMDADDVAHPERLALQVQYLDAHPECLALGCEALRVDPQRRPLGRLGVALDHAAIESELLAGRGDALLHPTLVMRRDAFEAIGGYRVEYDVAEDLDLLLRLAERGRLANLPQPLLEYRQHLGKVSGRRKGTQRRRQDAALREAYARRGLPSRGLPRRPPVPEELSAADAWHRWASWALESGQRATARRYAFAVWRREPLAPRSARLLLRALLGWRRGPAAAQLAPAPHGPGS